MKNLVIITLLASVALPAAAADKGIATFAFETLASRNAAFDRSSFLYPDGNDLAGQINANTGDVRLDGVLIDGAAYGQAQLQLVSAIKIVQDDAVDNERGGGNLTAGFGIGAELDPLLNQGQGSTTPTPELLAAAQANFNLSSIIAVRENAGTAIYEVTFEQPTDRLLLWERGNSGDVEVTALDESGAEIGSLLVLDGVNDGDKPSAYVPTGIFVTTYVQDGFLNQGQQLSAVGLKLDAPAKTFRFTVLQEPEGDGAVRYNGPDLKIISIAPTTT
jgi:hypothetical protein